jgi:hypothetical protein
MPIETKPTASVPFPPKNGTAYKVRSGDTWGTIASANRIPPADLIKYNFGTVRPAEVNWCLRTLVGCKQATFDKKNYIFSDDARPGLIFLPAKGSGPAPAPAPASAPPTTPRAPAPVTPAVLAEEEDVTAGDLRVNDAYDLKFSRLSTGDYELLCFMKIQFFFEDSADASWTDAEKKNFMKDWEVAVKTSWGGRVVKTLPTSKKNVFLRFGFSIQEGGWMFDHWEITVTKIKAGTFRTSYVQAGMGNVTLDSEDLTPTIKGDPSCTQRGAVHEFGHMLGIDDEYLAGGAHVGDTQSIMHSCETVSMRHNAGFVKWLDVQIAKLGLD